VTGLTLGKLTRPQSAAMASRLSDDKALPADLLEQILDKTDDSRIDFVNSSMNNGTPPKQSV
jgi:hypothetical protein